jgi:hypothetical protein
MLDQALLEYARTFADKINADLPDSGVHPSGAAIVHEYLMEMRDAAARGDAAEVAKLTTWINEKIAEELAWHNHCLRSAKLSYRRKAQSAAALCEREERSFFADLQNGLSVHDAAFGRRNGEKGFVPR